MNKKFSTNDINEIRKLWLVDGLSTEDIRKKYPISKTHLVRLCRVAASERDNLKSLKSPNRKLNEYSVKKILIFLLKGSTHKDLAKQFNVSPTTIYLISKGKNWPHVFQGYQKKYKKEIISK